MDFNSGAAHLVTSVYWFAGVAGGIGGAILAGFFLLDRFRRPSPSLSIEPVNHNPDIPILGKSVIAVVKNPRSSPISVSTKPARSDFVLTPYDDEHHTRQIVDEISGDGWQIPVGPGAEAQFHLLVSEKAKSFGGDAKLTLTLAWVPTQYGWLKPRPRLLREHITKQHFYDLKDELISSDE